MKGCVDKYSTKGSSKPHWRYRIYRGKDASGKKQFKIEAGFKKQGEAADAIRIAMAEIEASSGVVSAPKKTLGEWLRSWLETYAVDRCQPKTLERYQQLAGYILDAPEGSVQLAAVDLAELSHTQEQTKAGLRIKRPKNGKSRSCRLPLSAIAALQFLRDQQSEHRRLFAGDYQDHGLMFCQPSGAYHEPDLVSQVVIRRMRKAGISEASFHTLRHTHASNLLSRGVPLPAVSARLGNSDTNVTARVYSHALPADDQRPADTWDAIIKGPMQ